jgi:NSS family neurotransmitter:Na+ symporter
VTVGGRDFLSALDAVTSDALLPLAGLLTVLFVGWVWGADAALGELRRGAAPFPERLWRAGVRLVVPATVAAVLLAGLAGVR